MAVVYRPQRGVNCPTEGVRPQICELVGAGCWVIEALEVIGVDRQEVKVGAIREHLRD